MGFADKFKALDLSDDKNKETKKTKVEVASIEKKEVPKKTLKSKTYKPDELVTVSQKELDTLKIGELTTAVFIKLTLDIDDALVLEQNRIRRIQQGKKPSKEELILSILKLHLEIK